MPEDMNIEAAHRLSEPKDEPKRMTGRRREIAEIVEVVILAIVAVATAWSGYQAARWDGQQAFLYGESTKIRVDASEAATLGGQQRLQDISTFNTWIVANAQGEDRIADLYVGRFSPEYRAAFNAWLATMPFTNPDAPPGPSFMPEYRNPQTEHAAELNEKASETFDEGTEARETADRYVRQTVLFATVLFLIAISQRFTYRAVRLAATSLAAALLVFALLGVITLPRI
jgi:hypothetical protein